jgi:hypothetical protein
VHWTRRQSVNVRVHVWGDVRCRAARVLDGDLENRVLLGFMCVVEVEVGKSRRFVLGSVPSKHESALANHVYCPARTNNIHPNSNSTFCCRVWTPFSPLCCYMYEFFWILAAFTADVVRRMFPFLLLSKAH